MVEFIFTDPGFLPLPAPLNSTVGRRQRWTSGCQFQSLGFPVNHIHVRRNPNLIITRSLLTTSVVSAASREGTTKDNKTRDKGRLLIRLFETLHRTNIIYFWLENIVCQHVLFFFYTRFMRISIHVCTFYLYENTKRKESHKSMPPKTYMYK